MPRLRDKAELVRLAGILGLHLPAYFLYRLHLQPWIRQEVIDYPQSEKSFGAVAVAYGRLADIAPPFLLNHSVRTYWLSRSIAATTRTDFDDELLFVASLAHDVGLIDAKAREPGRDQCFSIRSAVWAMTIACETGWDETRIERLGDAITLNLNGTVQRRRGIEARLMMLDVLADVTGFHRWRATNASAAPPTSDATSPPPNRLGGVA